jgi:hypothetical protein
VTIADSLGNPGAVINGPVTVDHVGNFSASNIWAHRYTGNGAAGDVNLDGGDSSGDLTVGAVQTYRNSGNYGYTAGDITISNYANVIIDEIQAWNLDDAPTHNRDAGDVTISDGITGDITITGEINLRGYLEFAGSLSGALELAADGTITLGAGLDLSKVLYASFDSGPTTTYIVGEIFGTDGLAATSSTIGNLWAAPGGIIYYDPDVNGGLLGQTYDLADLDGNPGGGSLMVQPGPVPEPAGLGIAGLILMTLKRRRR